MSRHGSSVPQADIDEYQAVTGISDNLEIQTAIRAHGGDLNAAVNTFFSTGSTLPAGYSEPPPEPDAISSAIPTSEQLHRRGAAAGSGSERQETTSSSASQGINESSVVRRLPMITRILFIPLGFVFGLAGRFFQMLGFLFPIIPRAIVRLTSGTVFSQMANGGNATSQPNRNSSWGVRASLGGAAAASRTYRTLSKAAEVEKFPISIYQGGHQDARQHAQKNFKFFVAILISFQHEDTAKFIRQTLLSESVVNTLNDEDRYTVWVGDVEDVESFRIMNILNPKALPHIRVTAPCFSSNRQKSVDVSGCASSDDLVLQISQFAINNDAAMKKMKEQAQDRESSHIIRTEQNAAYEQSLVADREKKIKKEAKLREAAKKAEEARVAEQKEREEEQKRVMWYRWKKGELRQMIDQAGESNRMPLRLRLPKGKQVVVNLPKDTMALQLYEYVDCFYVNPEEMQQEESLLETDERENSIAREPAEYEHNFTFTISSRAFGTIDSLSKSTILTLFSKDRNIMVEMNE